MGPPIRPRNIVLIGMPGAGKSTIGVLLAKATARDFVDTDVLIQVRESRTLQQITDTSGYLRLRQIEEDVLLGLDVNGSIIATGGSAVYSDRAMEWLKQQSLVVFLEASLGQLRQRIHNYHSRGIACRPGQSFESLFGEREQLYRHYADRIVNCDNKLPEAILQQLVIEIQETT